MLNITHYQSEINANQKYSEISPHTGQNQFSSLQLLSHVWLFVTPWTAAHQASLSITSFWSLLKLMSIKLVMPSNHLILCHTLLLLPSVLSSFRVFPKESVLHIRWPKYLQFQLRHPSFQWIFRTDFLYYIYVLYSRFSLVTMAGRSTSWNQDCREKYQ